MRAETNGALRRSGGGRTDPAAESQTRRFANRFTPACAGRSASHSPWFDVRRLPSGQD